MLVKRIQEKEFVDISELTVDSLSMAQGDESSKSNHSKKRPVTSIIEWAQLLHIAILAQAKPKRTLDLLGYQHLVLEGHFGIFRRGMDDLRPPLSADCSYPLCYNLGTERWRLVAYGLWQ